MFIYVHVFNVCLCMCVHSCEFVYVHLHIGLSDLNTTHITTLAQIITCVHTLEPNHTSEHMRQYKALGSHIPT